MPRIKKTAATGAAKPKAAKSAKRASKGAPKGAPRKRADNGAVRAGDALVVVESPTKAKTIGKYLGAGYSVKATVGHIRDLPTRKLGVEIEGDGGRFIPEYVTIKGKTQTVSDPKKAAKSASRVFLATDPDREGEAIAWHVSEQIGPGVPTQRILFHEITRDAIHEAMERPGEIDQNKVDAQQARRILDRLVGYKASPILWKTIKTGLSAGRVQTVALRLIVEREDEIRKFVPVEYWSIAAQLRHGGQDFEAGLHKVDGHKPALHSAADADAVVQAVRGVPFVVTSVDKKKRSKRPGAPFTTSTLQQEA